ncbi:hypothetical protein [Vibrio azureus]|uniref:hypothetical protein n=1 Tax=Vibrio azureus TaxID=512649 RepID=UPI000AF09BEF|nr:hypothetical protein [Vibrio azureus]
MCRILRVHIKFNLDVVAYSVLARCAASLSWPINKQDGRTDRQKPFNREAGKGSYVQ